MAVLGSLVIALGFLLINLSLISVNVDRAKQQATTFMSTVVRGDKK